VAERWIRSRAAATVTAVDRAFADDNYGEFARLLYEATWSELCDWGIELAKVRLAHAALPDAEREATWWTLVEALHVYLRLLHPVMPFVTEALWAALPRAETDPELLIVARWPSASGGVVLDGARDEALEQQVTQLLDLIRAVRNARATVGSPTGAWLPLDVHVPDGLAPAYEGLAPAIERLARARPLNRVADRATLDRAPAGSLGIVAGEIDARLQAGAEVADADRARVEKELAQASAALDAVRTRLADWTFLDRAPAAIVDGARARETELAERVERLRGSLAP
jgi:valyl-tRNA synthetase